MDLFTHNYATREKSYQIEYLHNGETYKAEYDGLQVAAHMFTACFRRAHTQPCYYNSHMRILTTSLVERWSHKGKNIERISSIDLIREAGK